MATHERQWFESQWQLSLVMLRKLAHVFTHLGSGQKYWIFLEIKRGIFIALGWFVRTTAENSQTLMDIRQKITGGANHKVGNKKILPIFDTWHTPHLTWYTPSIHRKCTSHFCSNSRLGSWFWFYEPCARDQRLPCHESTVACAIRIGKWRALSGNNLELQSGGLKRGNRKGDIHIFGWHLCLPGANEKWNEKLEKRPETSSKHFNPCCSAAYKFFKDTFSQLCTHNFKHDFEFLFHNVATLTNLRASILSGHAPGQATYTVTQMLRPSPC